MISDFEICDNMTGYVGLWKHKDGNKPSWANNSWNIKCATYGWSYSKLCSAKKWGKPNWMNRSVLDWCVLDLETKEVVWRSWDE